MCFFKQCIQRKNKQTKQPGHFQFYDYSFMFYDFFSHIKDVSSLQCGSGSFTGLVQMCLACLLHVIMLEFVFSLI